MEPVIIPSIRKKGSMRKYLKMSTELIRDTLVTKTPAKKVRRGDRVMVIG